MNEVILAEIKKVIIYNNEKGWWFAVAKPLRGMKESVTFTGRSDIWNGLKPPPVKSLVILKDIYKTRKGFRANFAEFA
jgi:hypothetical protein